VQFEIVKVYSGTCATFYSVKLDGENNTLFESFINENKAKYPKELASISSRIKTMADKTGAREQFFKLNEGKLGDGVCALYDDPDKNLRLYCIRNGSVAVILGSGGEKPKGMKALQESEKLTMENQLGRDISAAITQALKDHLIKWSDNGMDLLGDGESMIIEI
jgi:putative component of toxin-antitoxin plasmid stabilization module